MWYQDLKPSYGWSALWYGSILCGNCGAIRTVETPCPVCNATVTFAEDLVIRDAKGIEHRIPQNALMGAEGRYEDHVYLKMLQREWLRPLTNEDRFDDIFEGARPSPRSAVVLVFGRTSKHVWNDC